MSIPTSVATMFRTHWATRLVDTCTIQRQTSTAISAVTGIETPSYSSQYSGNCLVRPGTGTETDAGQEQKELRMFTVYIPYDETGILPGDVVTVTSTNDGMLNGATLTVRNVTFDTYDHVRELVCEDVITDG